MTRQIPLAAIVLSLVAGCGDRPPQESPASESEASAPTPSPVPSETAEPEASILRPELDHETIAEEAPVQPLAETVYFPDGGARLDDAALATLREVLDSKALAEGWKVVLRGHSDSPGTDEANLRISKSRAQAVADRLIEGGVEKDRIEIVALGEMNPAEPNALPDGSPNEEGRAKNRRVEIEIAPPAEAAAKPASEPSSSP